MSDRLGGATLAVARMLIIIVAVGVVAFNPAVSQAKAQDEQDQIILLNDSASALEDSDPGLSKSLAQYADEKEKDWEANANKVVVPIPITDKYIKELQDRLKLLTQAIHEIQPTYPLIAKSLGSMVKDMDRIIENEK